MEHYSFAGGTAVVTGAASGIGEALATQLAERGSNLVLVGPGRRRLTLVAERLRAAHPGLRVATHVADLADDEGDRRAGRDAGRRAPRRPRCWSTTPGVALGGRFDQVTLEEFDWVMAVNFRSVVRLTHALLPVLKAHPGAHLVNVSSVFGIFAPAGQAAYSASKFAVRGSPRPAARAGGERVGVHLRTPAASRPGSPRARAPARGSRSRSTSRGASSSPSC